ncbi:MAG: hypothetical protein V2I41_00545 [Pseudomonadales bacterium]|jgi:hypothetical protein|nr:hypothetical protein [Pseudomonadales bacterium]
MSQDNNRVVVSAFRSPDGKALLEYLEGRYQRCRLYNDNPHKTAYNCGQFDLVEELKQILETNKYE